MLLPRLQPPLRAALTSIARSAASGSQSTCLNEAFAQLAIKSSRRTGGAGVTFVRHASHKAQGAVNKAKDGPGKRLGAKKSGGLCSYYYSKGRKWC
jgi:large subunit ribosomal protein L27